jgi:hypothetical protein
LKLDLLAGRIIRFVLPMVALVCAAFAASPVITVGPNLGTWSIGEVQMALTASGGSGGYTWQVTGTLPTGVALRTDVPSWFPTGSTAGLIGVASAPGTYNFTVSVTSGGVTVNQACTMKITGLTVRDLYSGTPDYFVNVPMTYTLTPLNNAGSVTYAANGALPAGIALSSAGVISGTPTVAGNFNVNFSMNDGVDTVFRSVPFTVYTVQMTTNGVLPNATRNAAYSTTITATGGTAPYTFAVTSGSLPNGVTLNSSTGVISGTPTSGNGSQWVWISATDHNNNVYQKIFSLDVLVLPVTAGHIQANSNLDDCYLGYNCNRSFSIYSGGTAPFTWTASGLPPGTAIRYGSGVISYWQQATDGEIWGVPTALGTYNVQVTVTDANGLVTGGTFPLKISALAIAGGDYLTNGTVNTPYSRTLRVLGGSGNYSASLLSNSWFPAGLSLGGMTVSGTPLDAGGFNGVFSFNDGAGKTLQITHYFNINAITPVSVSSFWNLGTITQNASYSTTFSACCASSLTWSVVSGSLPQGMGLSATGVFSGTPTVAGTYTFRVKAADSANAANFGQRDFQIVVTPMSLTSCCTLPYGNTGSFYSYTIPATGFQNSIGFALEPVNFMPPGLTLNASTGVISGTPTATGQFFFTVDMTDGVGNKLSRNFTLYIFPPGGAPPIAINTPGNLGTWVMGARDYNLTASGGNGSYVVTLTAGSLPPGMVLRPDFPSFSSGAYDLTGVATTPGTYTFTLQASSAGQTATKDFTVKVTKLRVADYGQLPDASVGVAYSYTFVPAGNAGPVTWSATNLPPGLTLSSGGVLSGTPTQSGFWAMLLTLNDGTDTVTWNFTANISAFDIHFTSSVLLPSPTQYQPYTATVAAAGGTPPYTFTASSLPTGLTLNSSTGVITGTTTAGTGRWGLTLTVTDSHSVSRSRNAVFVVIGAPKHLPWLNPYSSLGYGVMDDCTAGSTCSRGISVNSGGTAPFTVVATGLPAGMAARIGPDVTASYIGVEDVELFGTPEAAGNYNIKVTLTDADGASVTETFPFHISTLWNWGSDSLPNGTRGVPYNKTMRLIGGTGQYSVTSMVNGYLAAGLTRNGMTVSGTPTENSNGSFAPEFLFTDSNGATYMQTEYFSIGNSTNNTIVVNNGTLLSQAIVGASYSTTLTACCVPSYTWSFSGGSLPPGLGLASNGVLSGTPTTAGTYTFLVTAADATNGANTGVRQFQLVVSPVAMTISSSLPSANVGTAYSQTLGVTGATGAVTWSTIVPSMLPPGVTLSNGGVLSGTPTASGYYSFTIVATDSAGNTALRGYNVQIFPAGVNPPLGLNFGPTLGPNLIGVTTFQLTASGGTPPYTFSYAPGAPVVPGMRVVSGPPLPTSFPSTVTGGWLGVITAPGVYTTTLRVTDSLGLTFDRPITWTVFNVVPLNQGAWPKATVGTSYSYSMIGYGGSGNYSYSSSTLPPGLTISTAGVVSGIPTTGGTFNFSVSITDLTANLTGSYSYSLVVNPFAITTGGVLPSGRIGTAYSQTLSAPNCGSGCTWTLVGGSLPGSVTLSTGGVLSGTPTGSFLGGLLVQASGSNGTTQKEFSLRIDFNTIQPVFITNGTPFGPTNLNNTFANAISVTGGTPPYTVTLDSGALPPGISLTGPGENLGSTLLPGFTYAFGRVMQTGAYTFTLKATDALSATTTKTFTWLVPSITNNYTSLPIAGTPLVYGQAYSQAMLALGGSGNYTWSGTLGSTAVFPKGLGITPGGVVQGTPTNTGSFTYPLSIADVVDIAHPVSQNVTFNVAGPTGVQVNAGNSDSYTVALGGFSTFTLSPSGGTAPYTYSPVTPYPPGCSIQFGNTALGNNTSTYVLYCQPFAAGTYSFTFQIADSAGNTGVRTATLTVLPFTVASSTGLPTASVGSPYSQVIQVWGSAVSWTLAAGSILPPGISVTGNQFTGTPTTAGSYSFTLTAVDGSGVSSNFTFTLTVSTIHITTPDIIPTAPIAFTPYTYAMAATGGSGVLAWSATGLPSGLSMSNTGVISGTPLTVGTFRFTVTVTDGVSPISRAFTMFPRYNDAFPGFNVLATQLADVRVGASLGITLAPFWAAAPVSWSVAPGSSLPPGLMLNSGPSLSNYSSTQTTGLTYIVGSPTTAGQYTFDLIGTDTLGNQVRRTFSLKVSQMEIVGTSLRAATVNTAYTEQLTASGGTPPYTFSFAPSSFGGPDMLPPGVTANASGLISGTPTATGTYSLVATAHDSAGHSFSITYSVSASNASGLQVTPSIFPYHSAGQADSTLLATNGASTYTWSVVSGALAPGMSLVVSGTSTSLSGNWSTPGTYTFTLRATDNSNNSNFAERSYTIVVSPVSVVNARASTLPPGRIGTVYSYTYKLTGGTPPYVFSVPFSSYLPAGISLSSAGVFSGTPTQSGSYGFNLLVTDAAGRAGVVNSTLNVVAAGQTTPMQGQNALAHSATVGVPYQGVLNAVIGGTPPFTYSVPAGSSLPPGLSLVPGSGNIPPYLTGIPTTAGSYTFRLTATDANGHTTSSQLIVGVSPIAVTPEAAANGTVGAAYSATLSASGGTPPYTFALTVPSSMPPGVSMNSSGVFSGTPTIPGFFNVNILIGDSAGNTNQKAFGITIDQGGTAQGISIGSDIIQMSYVLSSPAPAPLPVIVKTTSGSLPFNMMVAGVPGLSLSTTSGTANTVLNLNLNPTGLTVGTYSGVLAAYSANSANGWTALPVQLTVTSPPACVYQLDRPNGSIAAASLGTAAKIVTGDTCKWNASTTDPWIMVATPSGQGTGNLVFNTTANTGLNPRTGTIDIAGQIFTLTQFGASCSFALNLTSVSATAAGGTATVIVTPANSACTWTASGLGAPNGTITGYASVTLTIPANTSVNSRTLTATVAGQTVTVNQSGINCTVGLGSGGVSIPSAGGTGSVAVTTPVGCSYSTVAGPSWITVTSGGTGAGPGPVPLAFSVAANSTTTSRSATLTIGDKPFTIAQDATPCSVTVDASALGSPFATVGGSGKIGILANGSNCSWTVSSGATWANISPASGVGNGSVTVTAGSNAGSATARSTSLTVGGQSVGLSQAGTTCTYSLGSSTANVPSGGGSGSVTVNAPAVCTWTSAPDVSAPWVTITSSGSAGASDVNFTAAPNITSSPRSATLTVAGQPYSVSQAAAPCNYVLVPTSTSVASSGGSSSFNFSTSTLGCSTTALSYSSWLSVSTSSSADGTSGSVSFTAAANPAGTTRVGTIQFGGQSFTVNQTGAACAFSLGAYGVLLTKSGGSNSVQGSQSAVGCVPIVGTDQPSLVSLGGLAGPTLNIYTLPYTVIPFNSTVIATRRMTISFGGQVYTIKQTSW